MRLIEFYDPSEDNFQKRSPDDTRKSKLTLKELNKLRKYRDIKNAEEIDHSQFVRTMYSAPADTGGGLV